MIRLLTFLTFKNYTHSYNFITGIFFKFHLNFGENSI